MSVVADASASRADDRSGADEASDGPIVELRDVRFAWTQAADDVIDIDRFELTRGERLFISGPSGSGKSTLLSLLGAVVPPREGSVEVMGTNVAALPAWRRDRFRADHIGFVFQMFNLVPYLSMVDNVTLPCRFSRPRRQRALARSDTLQDEASRLLNRLELDLPSLPARSVTELSIGQQQRVAAARALIGAPELIIADEPTSALDEGTRERFLELLFSEADACGTSLLFVSHDTRLGALFDRRVSLAELNRRP